MNNPQIRQLMFQIQNGVQDIKLDRPDGPAQEVKNVIVPEDASTEDQGEPTASLFLGNLSWSIDEASIYKFFEGCGTISRIKWHERDGQFSGKCFIDFDSVESASAGGCDDIGLVVAQSGKFLSRVQ